MDFAFIREAFVLALGGVPVTLGIMLVSLVLSFFPALYLALGQIHDLPGVRFLATLYLSFVRSTPPILLILFFYSFFPSFLNQLVQKLGWSLDVFGLNPIFYAVIIYGVMTTASLSEILRSAILTVDKGQLEAALAIGLTSQQAYARVVLPQAFRAALPNICNLAITVVKGTSLVFVMTVKDVTAIAKIAAAYGYHYFEAYLVIFIIYIGICGGIQFLFSHLENRLALV